MLVTLGDGLYVRADLLATSWPIERDVRGTLVLPSRPPDDAGSWELEAPPIAGADRALEWFSEAVRTVVVPVWGRGYERHLGSITRAYVRAAVLVLPPVDYGSEDEGRSELDRIAGAMDSFIDDLCEWLEVLVGVDVIGGRLEGGITPRHVHPLPSVIRSDGTSGSLPTMNQLVTGNSGPPGIEPDKWRDAVDRTNASARPRLEHLLLRDGGIAALRDDRRRAIIDAVSGVEVALASAIRARLTAAPADASVKRVLKNAGGVMGLYDLAVALGVDLSASRSQVNDRLAERRNLAVHEGAHPTVEELRKAEETARAIVTDASPL